MRAGGRRRRAPGSRRAGDRHGPQSLLFDMVASRAAVTKRPSPSRTTRVCTSASGLCQSAPTALPSTFIRKRTAGPASHTSVREDSGPPRGASRNTRLGGRQPSRSSMLVGYPSTASRFDQSRSSGRATPRSGASQSCRTFSSLWARCSAASLAAATSSLCFASIRVSSSPSSADMSRTSSRLTRSMGEWPDGRKGRARVGQGRRWRAYRRGFPAASGHDGARPRGGEANPSRDRHAFRGGSCPRRQSSPVYAASPWRWRVGTAPSRRRPPTSPATRTARSRTAASPWDMMSHAVRGSG